MSGFNSNSIVVLNSPNAAKIYKHEFSLLERAYSGLSKLKKVTLYTPIPIFSKTAPVLPFNFAEYDSFKTASFLNQKGIAVRGGLHCAPTAHKTLGTLQKGAVRLSFGAFNTKNEVENFLKILSVNNFT
jgi:selenocysteine lyase/cysteine desulfurase